jgi:hypothetical protein
MLALRLSIALTAAALAGCAGVLTADAERLRLASPEFRAYVERVFREQNRVADALAFTVESAPEPPEALVVSEQALLMACAGVNELATAQRDSRRLGLQRRLALARGVPHCERAARAAAAILQGA